MSEVRALIQQLVETGVDPIDAAEIITRAAIFGASSAPKAKSAGAIRQERYRRNKASQVTQSDATEEIQKEGFPHTHSEENTPKEKTPKGVKKKSPVRYSKLSFPSQLPSQWSSTGPRSKNL
nr:hypothetical protein [Brucella sp. 09RB8471]